MQMNKTSTEWPIGADGKPVRRPTVYQFSTDRRSQPWLSDMDKREPLIRFLHAHGLRNRFQMGDVITVREHEDGTLWLHTRRMTGEAPGNVEVCPHCACCLKTELYSTPLVAPVPYPDSSYMHVGYRDRLTFTPN